MIGINDSFNRSNSLNRSTQPVFKMTNSCLPYTKEVFLLTY